ncbi:MAG: toluene tolerance protein [Desulfovibrio sp. S3730MH75]|nr:MAG: toluene tolerance protein [Desulfovibrio sp. S3730MH75]
MKRLATISLFTILLCFVATACFATPTQSPKERLRTGIQNVIDVLNDPQYKGIPSKKAEQATEVREKIKDFFNFRELSKRTVGRPWLKFTPDERDRFIALFTEVLEYTYLGRIEDYTNEKVSFDKETIIKEKYAQVDTRLLTSKEIVPVIYRLKLVDNEWNVYDVKIEGISLVNNYRTQFSGIINTSSNATFESSKKELFDRLEQKCSDLKNKPAKK